jgi:Sulfotransferase domain
VTWTQRLVSLLVFDGPDLPAPLSTVSPWVDLNIRPSEEVVATLDAQDHRRFLKTHTPLDGLVLDDRVTYLGVGRDPRDAAMSELRQWDNMNLERLGRLQAGPVGNPIPPPPPGATVLPPPPGAPIPPRPPGAGVPTPVQAFRDWMEGPIMPPEGMGNPPPKGMGFVPPEGFGPPPRGMGPTPPVQGMGSLASILHQFGSLWDRRQLPNVALFHYADYQRDLVGEFVRLGRALGYQLGRDRAEELVAHATLAAMRDRAAELAPDAAEGIWHSNERVLPRRGPR